MRPLPWPQCSPHRVSELERVVARAVRLGREEAAEATPEAMRSQLRLVTRSERAEPIADAPDCAECDGTGKAWERHDYTGQPVPCVCPACGGLGLAQETQRDDVTVNDGEVPW